MAREIIRCRVCGGSALEPVLGLGEQRLTGVFPRSPRQEVTSGPLELVRCAGDGRCGLVQLRHSYDPGEMYGERYGYRSSLNRSMAAHLEAVVDGLLGRVGLAAGDLVLDIGSNDGTLLARYPGTVTRVGMDPSAGASLDRYPPGAEVVVDFFSAAAFRRRCGGRRARIVTSVAVFYALESPVSFVEQVADVLEDDGLWLFEQSYLPAMLAANAYDTVCHEHLEYYGLRQIAWVLGRCGLKVVDVEVNDVNGGSIAVLAAKTGSAHPEGAAAVGRLLAAEERAGLATPEPYDRFRRRVFRHRDDLLARLDGLARAGATIVGYGASTKGNVILQFCGITPERLPCIAEVNPDKFGCFTPGTGIPIVSEADAHARRPDCLLVLPWHFRRNLLERERAFLDRGGRMLFPLPEIEIVGR